MSKQNSFKENEKFKDLHMAAIRDHKEQSNATKKLSVTIPTKLEQSQGSSAQCSKTKFRAVGKMLSSFVSFDQQTKKNATERSSSADGDDKPPLRPERPVRPAQTATTKSGLNLSFNFFKGDKYKSVSDGLRMAYNKHVKPCEDASLYNEFVGTKLETADFDADPMILVIGQYSTGKTTFLRNLVGKDYSGINIGPEPTTDKFMVIMNGPEDKTIQGNALIHDSKLPFRSLEKFGNLFLNRFQGTIVPSTRLRGLTLIDSPGILSGKKQYHDRGYNFSAVIGWFASRVDRILLIFDSHKLDISDELREVLREIRPYDEKLRIILNKADSVDPSNLIRIYGALMYQLGKALETPDVPKVSIGSFWDRALKYEQLKPIFDKDAEGLMKDLHQLPQLAALRKINDFSKRARCVRMHTLLLNELIRRAPSAIALYKREKQIKLIENLEDVYLHLKSQHPFWTFDSPEIGIMQDRLRIIDWSRLKKVDEKLIERVSLMLEDDMTKLYDLAQGINQTEAPVVYPRRQCISKSTQGATGILKSDERTPFKKSNNFESHLWGDNFRKGEWIVACQFPDKYREWIKMFEALNTVDGKITGGTAKEIMGRYNLLDATLAKIWNLADVGQDSMLDVSEFCLAMYLIHMVTEMDEELPAVLPVHLHPKKYQSCGDDKE